MSQGSSLKKSRLLLIMIIIIPLMNFISGFWVFFSMMLVWVYNDAVFDRGVGLIVTYLIVWVYTGGDGEGLAASDDDLDDGTDVQVNAP